MLLILLIILIFMIILKTFPTIFFILLSINIVLVLINFSPYFILIIWIPIMHSFLIKTIPTSAPRPLLSILFETIFWITKLPPPIHLPILLALFLQRPYEILVILHLFEILFWINIVSHILQYLVHIVPQKPEHIIYLLIQLSM